MQVGLTHWRWDAELEGLEGVIARAQPDAVLCCTALSSIRACEEQPQVAQRLNVELPSDLARISRRLGLRTIHISTDLVFDGRQVPPGGYGELDEPHPLSRYGQSKWMGERAVLEADPGALVVRAPLLWGESFGRGRGASDALFAAISQGERPMCFTDEYRTPQRVDLLAAQLVQLLEQPRASGLLHLPGPSRLSRYEFALERMREAGLASDRIQRGVRADLGLENERPMDTSLRTVRAQEFLCV